MAPAPADDVRVLGVQLRDFRTYARAHARLGPGLTVLHGPNGAGKSNLLEAIYFAATGRSPRTRSERELVRFGAQATRVTLCVCHEGSEHELTVAYGRDEHGEATKRMTCDGAVVERPLEAPHRPLVSVFMPDRLELVKGAPALRRAHLDQLVAAVWPLRAQARREYSRVLAQRNALLGRIRAGRSSQATLSSWDAELAASAIELQAHRREAIELLAGPFAEHARLLGLEGRAEIEYRPRSRATDVDGFLAELSERRASDLERGFCGHGPHRDEVSLRRDGRELRAYGSQGEQRMALLALLLAERALLCERRGHPPLMLLDDVMSELDETRRERLSRELASDGQSVIATTDLAHVPGAGDAGVTSLRIAPGAIHSEALAA